MWPIKDPESTAAKRELEKAQRDYPKLWLKKGKFDFRLSRHDDMKKVETSLVRILWAFLNLGEESLEVIKMVLEKHSAKNIATILKMNPNMHDSHKALGPRSFLGIVYLWRTGRVYSDFDIKPLVYNDVLFFEVLRQILQKYNVLEDLGISGVEDSEIGGTEVKLLLLALACRKAQRELGSDEIFDVLALLKRLDYVPEDYFPAEAYTAPFPDWVKKGIHLMKMEKIRRADIRTLLEFDTAEAMKICSLKGKKFLEAYVEIVRKRINNLLVFIESDQGNASLS